MHGEEMPADALRHSLTEEGVPSSSAVETCRHRILSYRRHTSPSPLAAHYRTEHNTPSRSPFVITVAFTPSNEEQSSHGKGSQSTTIAGTTTQTLLPPLPVDHRKRGFKLVGDGGSVGEDDVGGLLVRRSPLSVPLPGAVTKNRGSCSVAAVVLRPNHRQGPLSSEMEVQTSPEIVLVAVRNSR
nr:hypothetical protein Iba_chr13fCG5860 [Ipomoea batatas]